MTVVRQGLFFQLESSNQRHLPHAVEFPSLPTIVKNILIEKKKKKSAPFLLANRMSVSLRVPLPMKFCVHSDHSLFTLPMTRLKVEDWDVVWF